MTHKPASGPLPLVHVGLMKAASSTIQYSLFQHHPQLEYFGVNGAPGPRWPNPFSETLLSRLSTRMDDAEAARLRESYLQATAAGRANGKVPVISSETLVRAMRREDTVVDNIRRALGPVRILMVLRNPYTWFESLYFQQFSNHLRNRRPPTRMWRWDERTFDTFTEHAWRKEHHGAFGMLACREMLEPCIRAFGPGNVKLALYEELVDDPERFMARICTFAGVDPEARTMQTGIPTMNPRITEHHVRKIRQLTDSPWGRLFLQFAPRLKLMRAVGLNPGHSHWEGPRVEAHLSAEWRTRIADYLGDDLRWAADTFDLPLQRYDYPV